MGFLVLVLSLTNLAAGYALAVLVRQLEADEAPAEGEPVKPRAASKPAPKPAPPIKEMVPPPQPAAEADPAVAAEAPATVEPGVAEAVERTPEDQAWMEASVDEFKAELQRYREQLATIDDRMRQCAEAPDEVAVKNCYDELKDANQQYVETQAQAVQRFTDNKPAEEMPTLGEDIKDAVLKQTAQIQEANDGLKWNDVEQDLLVGCQKLLDETAKLVDVNSQLEGTLACVKTELVQESEQVASGPQLEFSDRDRLEAALAKFWQDDPSRERPLTLAMIDVDRVAQLNSQLGTPATDRVLEAIRQMVAQSARSGDVIAPISGQRFLLMLPDSDARNGTSAVERVRQHVEACRFECKGEPVAVTVTCGVAEAAPTDNVDSLIDRAESALQEAKRYGRNRTFLHEGMLPAPVTPPQFDVDSRTLAV